MKPDNGSDQATEESEDTRPVAVGAFRHRCQIGRDGDLILTRIITEGQEATGQWVPINDSQSHSTVADFILNLDITAADLDRAHGRDPGTELNAL